VAGTAALPEGANDLVAPVYPPALRRRHQVHRLTAQVLERATARAKLKGVWSTDQPGPHQQRRHIVRHPTDKPPVPKAHAARGRTQRRRQRASIIWAESPWASVGQVGKFPTFFFHPSPSMFPLDADSDFVDASVSLIDALWLLCVVAVACFTGGLARYSESARGSTTPTPGGLPVLEPEEARNGGKRAGEKRSARGGIRGTSDDEGNNEADISDDLDKKRKQGPQADFQHKRQRTRMQEGTSPSHAAASTATSSTPSLSSRPKIALTSTGVQHGEVGSEGRKGAKYVTRSKVMDTTSLAGVDPAIMASRKQGANRTTVVDSSTSTDASPPHMARTPSPSGYPFPSMHSAHGQPRTPLVTLEDWEDLKEVWNRCLEMVDVEEPEDVLPVLRGIIHECSWFLHEFEEPSVIFMAPRQVTTPMYVASAICQLY
jgi:hypothetical protein